MQFSITYQARTEEEFRRLYAEFGEAVKPTKTRRTDAELLVGMTVEEKEQGLTIADIPAGRAPIPTKKTQRVVAPTPAPSVTLNDGNEY